MRKSGIITLMVAMIIGGARAGEEYVDLCLDAIINCRYDHAIGIVDSVAENSADDPLPALLRVAALTMREIDFDQLIDSSAFFASYGSALAAIDAHEQRNGVSSFSLTMRGFCLALHATYNLRDRSYYTALSTGFESLRLLEDARTRDSANVDALLIPGLYGYAKGELRKRLALVMFWYPASRSHGIELLIRCSTDGSLTRTIAFFALADIYTRDGQIEKSVPIVERLLRRYPDSRFALWAQAKLLEAQKSYGEAAGVYGSLADSYGAQPEGRHSFLVTQNKRAHLLAQAGRHEEASETCRAIMKLEHSSSRMDNVIFKDTKRLLRKTDGNHD